MMKRIARYTALASLAAFAAGCAAGPDFQRPETVAAKSYVAGTLPEQTASGPSIGGKAQRFVQGKEVQAQWWKAFGSPALDALVATAIQANPDLKAAGAALRAAREAAAAQRGAFWPRIDAGANSTRQKTSDALTGPEASLYTLYTAQLSIGYVPDVFGGNRRQVEMLDAQTEMQHFQREAVYMTLVSNVVTTAIEEASLRAQIKTARDLIDLAARLLELARYQHRVGQVGGYDVIAQEAALAQVQASLPPLEKQLAQQRNRLAVLTGRLPSEEVPEHFELDSLTLPTELPVSLPSRLVEQRPDIRAAEAQLHAASAQIGIATAARLPAFTLTATLGSSALEHANLLRSGMGVWSIVTDLLQPIFRGGTLLHQQRAAEANYEQAEAQYRHAVLTAFQNTTDTLQAIVSDGQVLRAAHTAEAAAQKSLKMARLQREFGAATQADLIIAQQVYLQAALALVQAQASRYVNTVALYQALGGWWFAPDRTRIQAQNE